VLKSVHSLDGHARPSMCHISLWFFEDKKKKRTFDFVSNLTGSMNLTAEEGHSLMRGRILTYSQMENRMCRKDLLLGVTTYQG